MLTHFKPFQRLWVLILLILVSILLNGCGPYRDLVSSPAPPRTEAARAQPGVEEVIASLAGLPVDDFLRESLNQIVLRDPETLTVFGMAESFGLRNDRLNDLSIAYIRETQALESGILDLLRRYERENLTPEARIDYDVYEWYLDNQVRGHPFLFHNYQLHHFLGSYHLRLNSLFTRVHPLRDRQDIEDYISRLSQVNVQVEQLMDLFAASEEMGIIPPRFIVELTREDLLETLNASAANPADIDARSLDVYLRLEAALGEIDDLSEREKEDFLTAAQTEIEESFIPAFLKLLAYQDHLLTIATEDAGAWKLPDGAAYYAYMLRKETTTDLTPEEVHEIGLAEVARIHEEIRSALVDLGYAEEESLSAMLNQAIEDFGYYDISTQAGREQIFNDSKAYVDEIQKRSSEISDLQPALELLVVGDQVPEFHYSGGVPGIRPGIFFVAWLGDRYPKNTVQSIAYHEAIPGHYYQDAIMKGMRLLPLRYAGDFEAYQEGWGLYAERLAWEMGMYADNPRGNLGRLQSELLRAARLVADTGIHALGWTREEAQDYLDEATLVPGLNTREVDRYVVIPAQATAYKIGMLKILELRQMAMDELGDQFDLKEFHNLVLGNGSLPLETLEGIVKNYIEAKPGGSK